LNTDSTTSRGRNERPDFFFGGGESVR